MDEELVAEVDAHVRHPLRLAAAGRMAEKQQVALPEMAQIRVQRHSRALPRLLAGIAQQVNPVQEEHHLGQAGTVKSFGRVAAPEVGSAHEHPRGALDVLGGGAPGLLPRGIVLRRVLG